MNGAERPTRARDEHIASLRLSMYADGESPREERAEIEAHLSACPVCSARLDTLRSVSATLSALPRTTPSAGIFDKVLASARSIDGASNMVARERLGRARGNGPRLREVRLRDMDAPAATTPARRRSRWRAPFTTALPTIAALLLLSLTATLLMRSALFTTTPFPAATPTATIPPGDTVKATKQAVQAIPSGKLGFSPVAPSYLPAGASLDGVVLTTLTPGVTALDITWVMSAGYLRTLHLREQPAGAPTNDYASAPPNQMLGMTWRLGQYPAWSAMSQVEQPGWSGMEQSRGPVALLLDANPAPGSSAVDVATALRLTSLSLDAPYAPPLVPIGGPLPGSLLRSIASVAGTDGQMWTWDVTLSADNLSRNATIASTNGASVKESVTEITYAGAGVRLDNITKHYQDIPGPTPYNSPPSGAIEIAYHASDFLNTGQLWSLGAPVTIHLPDKRSVKVYDLYRVDSARPMHVYASATTGAVVAVSVETGSTISPGGSGGAHPYVSTTICQPYTVTYSWIIFEPVSQSTSLFNRTPPPDFKPGAVSLPFTCGG